MRFLFFLSILVFASCTCNKTQQKKVPSKETQAWHTLKIEIDAQKVWISASEDTVFCKQFEGDSARTRKFVMPQVERDSLFSLAKDAISNFKESEQFVTCYSGQFVSIVLEGGTGSIACNYSSIGDWTTVSPTLKRMSEMTFDKYQIAYKKSPGSDDW